MHHYHIISRISIYLLSLVLITFGVFHLINPHDLVVYVPTFVPGGIFWIYLVGVSFILVGIAFFTNRMVKAAGYIMAILLIIFLLVIHLPNYLHAGDKEMKQIALLSLLKDLAIAGFALHIAAGAHH